MLVPHVSQLCDPPAPLAVDGRPSDVVRCWCAESRRARLIGLLGGGPGPGEALLIPSCSAVHGLGLGRPLACLFLSAEGRVLARRILRPNRWLWVPRARAVVECRPDALGEAAPGTRVARVIR